MKRPDVIWIFTDEMRTDAVGVLGNRWTKIDTPNLDRIAETGASFTNCFCNSPVCVASRYSMLTGLHCQDTGVYCNETVWESVDHGLQGRFTTIPEVFAAAGYRTANFGKSHLPHGLMPWQLHNPQGDMKSTLGPGAPVQELLARGGEPEGFVRLSGPCTIHAGVFPPGHPFPGQAVTRNALTWLNEAQGPVFVRLSYLQPHTPVLPPEPFASRYRPADFQDDPELSRTSHFQSWFGQMQHPCGDLTPEQVARTRAHYYALVAWLDDQIGQVLLWLEERGRLDNAILIFNTDHGVSLGEGKRYGKQTFAPETHRVPLLIAAPGRIAPRQHRDDLCENLDFGRTLFSLAGLEAPSQFRGRDLFGAPPPGAVFSAIGEGEPDSQAFPLGRFGRWSDGSGWPRRVCVRTATHRLDMSVRQNGQAVTGIGVTSFWLTPRPIRWSGATWPAILPSLKWRVAWSGCSKSIWPTLFAGPAMADGHAGRRRPAKKGFHLPVLTMLVRTVV